MEQTVESLCNLLIRSRLLAQQDVQTMHRRWRLEAKEAALDVERFSKWIVANQYVTEYQAAALARGHADHFFLNQYKLLDRIGKGRMAGVYKAVHNLGHVVAIKVLPPSKARDPNLLARFQREARLAVRLKHPNVVRTFHMGSALGLVYIVMEYLEGETLEEVLKRRGRLPPAEGVRLIHQTLLGLQHIHEQGMIHRDIKPANLMLVPPRLEGAPDTTFHATVKIMDIGLGRAMFDENDPTSGEENFQLTTEGAMLGTPDYLAPEQARDAHSADIRADIYSVGCVLYHVLTGQTPFPEKNAFQQIVRHATEQPRPMNQLEPAIPDGLQQIVNWMMAKDPNQRYPTPERAAQALQVFLAKVEPTRQEDLNPQARSYLQWVDTHQEEEISFGPASETAAPEGMGPVSGVRLAQATPTSPPASTSGAAKPAPGKPGPTPPPASPSKSGKNPVPVMSVPPLVQGKSPTGTGGAAPVATASTGTGGGGVKPAASPLPPLGAGKPTAPVVPASMPTPLPTSWPPGPPASSALPSPPISAPPITPLASGLSNPLVPSAVLAPTSSPSPLMADVELVPVSPAAHPTPSLTGSQFNRRDYFLLALGLFIGGGIAVFIGVIWILFFR
jgi:serine/threonine protein kinase